MAQYVECFADIQRDDNDIWIGQEHVGYYVKQIDDGYGCGACRAECKLF